jgi:hypothetical protein
MVVALFAITTVRAEVSLAEFEAMKKEMADMRQQMNGMKGADMPVVSEVDTMLAPQCVKDQPVTTNVGKMKLGGLIQEWYYATERDTKGLFNNPSAGITDYNIKASQNTFQVRRAELNWSMDIHENITGYVMGDFAREQDAFRGTFEQLSGSNQGFVKAGLNTKLGAPAGAAPAILQDAIINVHDLLPHHDITIGQMLPYFNQEDFNPNGWLDFVERSWIGNFYPRDIGVVLHGAWWCDDPKGQVAYEGAGNPGRLQYWLCAFNSPGYYQDGATQDTADDNASKDFLGRLMIRPIWNDCFGKWEISGAGGFGEHGSKPLNQAVEALNAAGATLTGAHKTCGQRWSAYTEYHTGCFAQGLWFKAEYAWVKDSTANVPDGSGTAGVTGLFNAPGNAPPDHYEPFVTTGMYASAGYNFGNVGYKDCLPCWAKSFELDVRYQHYTNVWTQNPSVAYKVNTYATDQGTFGVNYYIKGHSAKIQMNYDIVRDPEGNADFKFHAVKNDVFSMNFQVMW